MQLLGRLRTAEPVGLPLYDNVEGAGQRAVGIDVGFHRANILGTGYTQIGIAVGKGTYEGRTTWLAVQEFGKPLSACPQADPSLEARIDADQDRLDQMKADLAARKQELEATPKPKNAEQR